MSVYRYLIVTIAFLASTLGSLGQATISFDKTTQHLGFVHQGDTLHFTYTFTNTGNQPLIVADTKVQCSCTTVQKPDGPVLPGKQGIIKVSFNTSSAIDRQDRTVTVTSNASDSTVVLRFKCIVLKAKDKS